MGCHALLQGIFLTQGWNLHLLCLLYWRWVLYPLSHQGSPHESINSQGVHFLSGIPFLVPKPSRAQEECRGLVTRTCAVYRPSGMWLIQFRTICVDTHLRHCLSLPLSESATAACKGGHFHSWNPSSHSSGVQESKINPVGRVGFHWGLALWLEDDCLLVSSHGLSSVCLYFNLFV